MSLAETFRRRGTGLVRTLVVATATLAILLVCFAIYQSSQLEGEVPAKVPIPRLPADPAIARDTTEPRTPSKVVQVNDMNLGGGRDVSLSLYRPQGANPFGEIAFARWEPVAGTTEELLVIRPEIRLQTKDGHGIRVTAQRAVLEGELRGGLNLTRGRLIGDVVIEYDRLTREERAKKPIPPDGVIDPNEIVRMDIEEIEFDLEYSKVSVQRGGVRLTARDVEFRAADMEIRFNEDEGRVEYMRISRGGRLELRELGDELGMSFGGVEPDSGKRFSLTNWLRETIEASLEARRAAEATAAPSAPPAPIEKTADEVPVFRLEDEEEKDNRVQRTIRYVAGFEDNVEVTQWLGRQAKSRLLADGLQVFRAITDEDRRRVRSGPRESQVKTGKETPRPPAETERIFLQWSGRLVVEAVEQDDKRWPEGVAARVIATGSTVRVSSPEGDAACARLTLDTDASKVWLAGTEADPVVVRSADQGTMTGLEVFTERNGDKLNILVTGPGTLERGPEEVDARSPSGDDDRQQPLTIQFSEKLDVKGRFVTRRRIDFTGGISSKEYRVIDKASFFGHVALRQGDTMLDADALTAEFGPAPRVRGRRQALDRVSARGHVAMQQGKDRVTAGQIDLVLTTDSDGRVVPLIATALGDVEAVQDERTIRARDKLIVDFEMVSRPPPPFDPLKAHARAVKAGLDVTKIDWEARRKEHETKERRAVGARRLRAYGDVTVEDPAQGLDLSAEEFDCAITDGSKIETATVKGLESHPASVRLDAFTVSGRTISINVPDQRADVPGAGRLSFRSKKDLDGRKLGEPIPIVIEWQERMRYVGRENRALFSGGVHAYSETTTEFNCRQLLVEFDDVRPAAAKTGGGPDWWIFQEFVDRARRDGAGRGDQLVGARFSKQPAYLLATGDAVALTAEKDPISGRLKSRARLAGPKLSVNLRSDVSKMLIEGHGTLLLEDYRVTDGSEESAPGTERGLFGVDGEAGPSNTLIEWHDFMSYDFSVDQTRFEGDVVLKHFSGSELERLRRGSAGTGPGRSTYLSCNVLTVDFLERGRRDYRTRERRMGRLSASRLRQFQASGDVVIQDKTEGLNVNADRVVFEKERELLAIYGRPSAAARIVVQRPNQLPTHVTTQRTFFDLKTGRIDASGVRITGR